MFVYGRHRLKPGLQFFPAVQINMADKVLTVCSQVSRGSPDAEFRVRVCARGRRGDLRLCSWYRGRQSLPQEMRVELDSLHAREIQQTWLSEGPHRGWGRILIHLSYYHNMCISVRLCLLVLNFTWPSLSVLPVEDDAEFPRRGGGSSRLFPLQLPLSHQGWHSRQGHWSQCGQKHDGMSSIFS